MREAATKSLPQGSLQSGRGQRELWKTRACNSAGCPGARWTLGWKMTRAFESGPFKLPTLLVSQCSHGIPGVINEDGACCHEHLHVSASWSLHNCRTLALLRDSLPGDRWAPRVCSGTTGTSPGEGPVSAGAESRDRTFFPATGLLLPQVL